ncbi:MAG: ribonuclease P protein component [Thermodesulfobacteriota bacterium]
MPGTTGAKQLGLPKTALLSKPGEFQAVYRQGRRLRGKEFSVIILPNGLSTSRLGISVHGVKRAVRRNRIKRIIREFYRVHRRFITPPSDVVIAVRRDFSLASPRQVTESIAPLLDLPLRP